MQTSKRFIITGGSKGIGMATAKLLIEQGRRVVIVARTAPADTMDAEFVSADLSDEASIHRAIAEIRKSGDIDGVVNNVGVSKAETLEQMSWSELTRIMEINLRPTVLFTQAGIEQMKQRRWGRIINVSSMLIAGFPNQSGYAAAKAAVSSLTRTWALECATFGVTVNAVAPGATQTKLFRHNNPPGSAGEKKYIELSPMKRIADPVEIASAIAYFASDTASFTTGQTLFVDGGTMVGCRDH